MMPGCNCT